MSEITVPVDYNMDRIELNQDELLASIGVQDQTQHVQYGEGEIYEGRQDDYTQNNQVEQKVITQRQANEGAISSQKEMESQRQKTEDHRGIGSQRQVFQDQSHRSNQQQQHDQYEIISAKNILSQDQANQFHDYIRKTEEQDIDDDNAVEQRYHSNNNNNQNYYDQINIQSPVSQNQDKRIKLLDITIDLGGGNHEIIPVYPDDNPINLAESFAQRHNLNPRLTELLAIQIQNNIEQVLQERNQKLEEDYHQNFSGERRGDENNFQLKDEMDDEYQYYDENNNPLEGTTKINDETNNTTANNLYGQLGGNNLYQTGKVNKSATNNNYSEVYNTKSIGASPFRFDNSATQQKSRGRPQQDYTTNPQMQKRPQINEVSKKLAEQKRPQSNHQAVHNRLHRQELEKTKIAILKQQEEEIEKEKLILKQLRSPLRKPVDPNELNIGARLYQKGIKIQEEKDRFVKAEKELKDQKLSLELKFKPELVNKQREKTQERKVKKEIELIQYGQQILEKKERARIDIQRQEEETYNHRPRINKKSDKMIREKSSVMQMSSPDKSLDIQMQNIGQVTNQDDSMYNSQIGTNKNQKFFALYNDAIQRLDRQDKIYAACIDKECTFKPTLVTQQSKLSKSVLYGEKQSVAQQDQQNPADVSNRSGILEGLNTPVYERLATDAKQKHEKKQIINQTSRNEDKIDPVTGRSYFRPVTGRSPKNRPLDMKNNIGDHLYKQHQMMIEKQNKLKKDEEIKMSEMRKQIHQNNKKSEKIVEQTKRQKLNDIFEMFDSDQDGVISAQKIDLHTLQPDLLEIFSPLLCEMEEIGTNLDRDEFIDASMRLFTTLNINYKNAILQFRRIPKIQEDMELQNCTFQPQINMKSQKLAEKHQYVDQQEGQLSLAERLLKKKLESENKIKQQRDEKQKNELQGCTFHPNISHNGQNNTYYHNNMYTFGGSGGAGGISMEKQVSNQQLVNGGDIFDVNLIQNDERNNINIYRRFQGFQHNAQAINGNPQNQIDLVELQQ